jgi:murein DD-endopeptidase MepM/ murein hydrolase activator NlpD
MDHGNRLRSALVAVLLAIGAQLLLASGAAVAATGGAGVPAAAPPPPPAPSSQGPAPSSSPSAGSLTITSAKIAPRKSFFYGVREPRLSFTVASTQPENDLRIDVLDSAGEVVRTLYRNDVAPNAVTAVRWDGTTAEGRPARNGEYSFKVGSQAAPTGSARPTMATASRGTLSFSFYRYIFPILGAHTYGDGIGAQRPGHTHQGQDLSAACGTPLVAVRGGRVQESGYQAGGSGNYIVIDGKGTGQDTVYMHMQEPALLPTGSQVRTGEVIGYVGNTGASRGCHLHFELWSAPGWYEGGQFMDPTPLLKMADRYS